jgi:hypothetical protein
MTTITVGTPAPVRVPRGSIVAARWFSALLHWFTVTADRRAARREVADRQSEAAQVRSYAQSMAAQDPRFAADLYAAADRHERS